MSRDRLLTKKRLSSEIINDVFFVNNPLLPHEFLPYIKVGHFLSYFKIILRIFVKG